MPLQISASLLRQRQTIVRYNWGFRFALWCAILWAVGYQGLDFIVHSSSLLGNAFANTNASVVGLAIAVIFTVMLSLVSLVWISVNHGLRDWWRTVTQLSNTNIVLLVSAFIGGAVALISYVMTFLMNSGFAVAMVMFYSSVGTLIAHLWYGEKVSRKGIVGLVIIALGCLFLYLAVSGVSDTNFFAVLGMGIFAGLGWGVEGALAARAMDLVDSNIAMSIRFFYEAVIWLLVFVLTIAVGHGEAVVIATTSILTSPVALLMLGLVALCIHFDYLCWYKSFIYCGVGRGLAVSTISSAFTVILGATLTATLPSFFSVLAFALMVLGVFLVFSGQDNRLTTLRNGDLEPSSSLALSAQNSQNLPLKSRVLIEIAEHGRLWDFELATKLIGSEDSRRARRLRKMIRLYLIEAQAAGLIVAVDDRVDNGSQFAQGKLLSNYALTGSGCLRLQRAELITVQEPAS